MNAFMKGLLALWEEEIRYVDPAEVQQYMRLQTAFFICEEWRPRTHPLQTVPDEEIVDLDLAD